jgi:hypothetical protein
VSLVQDNDNNEEEDEEEEEDGRNNNPGDLISNKTDQTHSPT